MLGTGRPREPVPSAPLALVAYGLLACVVFAHLLAHLTSSSYGGSDADLLAWWVRWTPYALSHGHLPLTSSAMFYPDGINAMWNTSVIALGVVATPLTLTVGPLAALNLLLVLAPVLSAWVVFLLARRYVRRPAAFVAGLVYGFSPYFVGQAVHLHLTFALFPPVLAACLIEIVGVQRLPPKRLGLALGAAYGVQLLIGEELLASSTVLAAATLVVLALVRRDLVRPRLRYALSAIGVALVTAVVIDALPLAVQFFGPQRLHGVVQDTHPGSDLLSLVVPTTLQVLHPSSGVVARVSGANLTEQTSYVGLPLLVLVGLVLFRLRRRPAAWLGVPLVIAAVIALGSHLRVYGHQTAVPLPADVFLHLPVLDSLIPVRFSVFVVLFASLLLAAALDSPPAGRRERVAEGLLLVLALVALVPAVPLRAYPVDVPAFFRSSRDQSQIAAGSGVLVLPWTRSRFAAPLLWQAEGGMRFRLVGGYGLIPGPAGRSVFDEPPPRVGVVVDAMAGGAPAPVLTAAEAERATRELHALRVRDIVIGPMAYQVQAASFLAALLHVPARPVGGVWLLDLGSR